MRLRILNILLFNFLLQIIEYIQIKELSQSNKPSYLFFKDITPGFLLFSLSIRLQECKIVVYRKYVRLQNYKSLQCWIYARFYAICVSLLICNIRCGFCKAANLFYIVWQRPAPGRPSVLPTARREPLSLRQEYALRYHHSEPL